MAQDPNPQSGNAIPTVTEPEGAQARQRTEEIVEIIASDLYGLASMLLGEGEESAQVVEKAVSTADVDCCCNTAEVRKNSYKALASAAIEVVERRRPGCLAAPERIKTDDVCIEDDDLELAGITGSELERMMAGPEHDRLLQWLEKLPAAQRAVFVLRAVAGLNAAETADLLKTSGVTGAAGWSREAAREIFQLGLCSLASQLLQSRNAR